MGGGKDRADLGAGVGKEAWIIKVKMRPHLQKQCALEVWGGPNRHEAYYFGALSSHASNGVVRSSSSC